MQFKLRQTDSSFYLVTSTINCLAGVQAVDMPMCAVCSAAALYVRLTGIDADRGQGS